MPTFKPQDPDFEAKARATFARQPFMATIGAELVRVAPGEVEIALPFRADLTQQHGYLHAGVVTAIVDSACGCAAFTLMPAGSGVVSVEYKVNLLAPSVGERMVARGRVLRPGRTLTVCSGEVVA
ncbi:MAG TPA: PaaI family thioesterase, partial [Thermoanaerobaculia bacterium]|nr:PaaI family thioesterase [Thermoanaerobaculia bacterium]